MHTPTEPENEVFRFAKGSKRDKRSRILAVCIAHQQRAGFGAYLDVREIKCGDCGAPGFNTGWGFWACACGAEIGPDGDNHEDCPKRARAALERAKASG